MASDRGHLARQAVMPPQVRTVRQALVVYFDYEVREAAGDGLARFGFKFEDPLVIAIDFKLRPGGQHAIALDAMDHGPADLFGA